MSYGDQPTSTDAFGRDRDAQSLSAVIRDLPTSETPLTIGVFGAWGSGKTSFLQMVRNDLDLDRHINGDEATCMTLWFDAWRYERSEVLWRALLLAVVDGLRLYLLNDDQPALVRLATNTTHVAQRHDSLWKRKQPKDATTVEDLKRQLTNQLDDLTTSLYRNVERTEPGELRINWGEAGKQVLVGGMRIGLSSLPLLGSMLPLLGQTYQTVVGDKLAPATDKAQEGLVENGLLDLAKIIRNEHATTYREQVQSLEQFYGQLKDLIDTWVVKTGHRLVIFIDDLDRCLPEQSLGVLEALKAFLDLPGCVFVLGVDHAIIAEGVRVHYQAFHLNGGVPLPLVGYDYLEKIIQLPYTLPPLSQVTIQKFLYERFENLHALGVNNESIKTIAHLISLGIAPNPRKVKRVSAVFRLKLRLRAARQQPLYAEYLAKLITLQVGYPQLYEQIAAKPAAITEWEQAVRNWDENKYADHPLASHDKVRAMLKELPSFARLGGSQSGLSRDELQELVVQNTV